MFLLCSIWDVGIFMALRYRVVAFGEAQGPWRMRRREAERDAIARDLGEFDEWGQFYLSAHASIQWIREEALMARGVGVRLSSCTISPGPQ